MVWCNVVETMVAVCPPFSFFGGGGKSLEYLFLDVPVHIDTLILPCALLLLSFDLSTQKVMYDLMCILKLTVPYISCVNFESSHQHCSYVL